LIILESISSKVEDSEENLILNLKDEFAKTFILEHERLFYITILICLRINSRPWG
jgi:hypothetical protein